MIFSSIKLFGRMYADLGIVFPIVNGTIQEYEKDRMGIFTINVSDEDFPSVEKYLNRKDMRWKEISARA